jgi:hypothetical protein
VKEETQQRGAGWGKEPWKDSEVSRDEGQRVLLLLPGLQGARSLESQLC